MLNSISKLKLQSLRCSCVNSLSRGFEFYVLQLSPLSTSAANAEKPYSQDANQRTFAAEYLKNRHGFPEERAITYSKYLNFDSTEKPDAVVAFFKKHDFSDAQISRVVRRWPIIFNYTPEPNFVPKIEYLYSLGMSSSDIVKVLTPNPHLLSRSLESQIIPCVDFLRSFLHSDEDVVLAIKRFPGIFMENVDDILMVNVGILREAGVPESHIAHLLRISCRRIAVAPDVFRKDVEEVKELGLHPSMKMFIHAIVVRRELSSSTWKEKIKCFEKWGLSENEVMDIFKKYPRFMSVSQDKMTRTVEFFINEMKYDLSVLLRTPQVFSLSFEKTIVPRCAIYRELMSKGIKKKLSLRDMLRRSQSDFLKRYVMRYEKQAPELLKMFEDRYPTEA